MNCSFCAQAGATIASIRPSTANRPIFNSFAIDFLPTPIAFDPSTPPSMREWPEPQFLPGDRPEASQPVRFDDQKKHDQRAEGHEFDIRDHRRRQRDPEDARQLVQKDRQDGDEGSPEKGTEYRAD